MKTKLTLGIVAIAIVIFACTPEELHNDSYKLKKESSELQEHQTVAKDTITSTTNDDDLGTGGEDDPDGD